MMNRPDYLNNLQPAGQSSATYIDRNSWMDAVGAAVKSPSSSSAPSGLSVYKKPTDRNSDTYAQDMRAYLRRAEYEDLARRYYPVEDSLISDVSSRDQLDQRLASVRANNSKYYDLARQSSENKLQRYGVTQSAAEKTASENNFQMQEALGDMTARNNTRTHIYDRNVNVIGGSGSRQALGEY